MEPSAVKVLVIDDEPSVTQLVGKVLARKGYQTKLCISGEEGLAALAEFQPDVLICDKNLPQMHGSEVITKARKVLPFLAVILMTAHPEPFSLGPERLQGYLAKPFRNIDVITDAVASAVEAIEATRRREELRARLSQVVAELTPGAKKRL